MEKHPHPFIKRSNLPFWERENFPNPWKKPKKLEFSSFGRHIGIEKKRISIIQRGARDFIDITTLSTWRWKKVDLKMHWRYGQREWNWRGTCCQLSPQPIPGSSSKHDSTIICVDDLCYFQTIWKAGDPEKPKTYSSGHSKVDSVRVTEQLGWQPRNSSQEFRCGKSECIPRTEDYHIRVFYGRLSRRVSLGTGIWKKWEITACVMAHCSGGSN